MKKTFFKKRKKIYVKYKNRMLYCISIKCYIVPKIKNVCLIFK